MTWDALIPVLTAGAASAGTAMIIRGLTPDKWRKTKPWSCALCLSVWSGLLVAVAQGLAGIIQPELTVAWIISWGLSYLGAVAVSVVILNQTTMFLEIPDLPLIDPP